MAEHLPFDIEEVYGSSAEHPLRKETYQLVGEESGRIASNNGNPISILCALASSQGPVLARVRFLTDFIFVKNGKIVYPVHNNCTEDFWRGVVVYGFMMAPTTGIGRWFAWSLHWWMDWPEKHMELVRIDRVHGLSKEKNQWYRNGNEEALWLNTMQGYSFALMEADDLMKHGWRFVIASWGNVGQASGEGDNTRELHECVPACPETAPPYWWHEKGKVAGRKAWQMLCAAHRRRQDEEEEEDSVEEDPTPRKSGKSSSRRKKPEKPKTAESGSVRRRSAPSTASSSKPKASAGSSSKPPPLKTRKRPASQRPEDEVGGETGSTDSAFEPSASRAMAGEQEGSQQPPPKRSRKMSVDHLLVGPLDSEKSQPLGKAAAKDRLQREADVGYTPGPSTQAANVLPSVQVDTTPTGRVLVPDSSPARRAPAEQLEVSAASQSSELAAAVRQLSVAPDAQQAQSRGQSAVVGQGPGLTPVPHVAPARSEAPSTLQLDRAVEEGKATTGPTDVAAPMVSGDTESINPGNASPQLSASAKHSAPATAPVAPVDVAVALTPASSALDVAAVPGPLPSSSHGSSGADPGHAQLPDTGIAMPPPTASGVQGPVGHRVAVIPRYLQDSAGDDRSSGRHGTGNVP
ncbi:hypothetical protein FRC07_006277 [Ceratobasidium sp. 392]|nr:hypothetical protein FRC07_006277 [Ceratobasidium sp. 392]